MKCQKCGFENSDNSKFCINCATNLSSNTQKICPNCKTENPNIAKFCQNCAAELTLDTSFGQRSNTYQNINSNKEDELRRELERLRLREKINPEKKKSNKKWIAIGIILLFVIALTSAYIIWFRSFQSYQTQFQVTTQTAAQEAASALGTSLQVLSISNDNTKYYIVLRNPTSSPIDINNALVNGLSASISSNSNTILPGKSGTFVITPTVAPKRGSTRTFTIQYSGGSIVHIYTDA